MNIQKAYDHWSATYNSDENRTRDLDRTVTEKTLAHWQCKSILEIGCGTGKNTHLLSQKRNILTFLYHFLDLQITEYALNIFKKMTDTKIFEKKFDKEKNI